MLTSVARGWTCGVLKPQGPRKPRVMEADVPMRAGKPLRSALTVWPPWPVVMPVVAVLKSKTKSASERRAMRSTASGARIREEIRDWALVGVVIGAGALVGESDVLLEGSGLLVL